MSSKFFTNQDENTLINKIEGIFKYRDIHFFDALVGYFRASGYFRIRNFIEKSENIRILVGINIDALVYKAHSEGLLFAIDENQAQEDFFNDIRKNIQSAAYDAEVESGMIQLISDISSKKLEIRIHPKQNIHAKLYIFREKEKHDHGYGAVITGSSNLTDAGLERNFEFNVELRDNTDIEFATETFEKLWLESLPVAAEYIDRLKKETYLNNEFTPYEVYLKFLIEYFGKSIEYDPNSVADLPKGFKRLSYQIDAVNDGYNKMMKHNGFFLADVVGLGKTIVAILIAKKYFYHNGFPSYRSRTLLIVPPAIKVNWSETIDKFQLDNVDIITNGSLHKVSNPRKYDLIIVDEAHKFRSDTAEMYNQLQKLCKTPTRAGNPHGLNIPKRVILISATPLNNRPEDIANLVYLFQDSKNSSLEVSNLQHFFRRHIDAYKKLKKESDIRIVTAKVRKIYEEIRVKVILPLMVRRTRTDLEVNKQYKDDLKLQGIRFPVIRAPEKIFYELEPVLEELYDKTIHALSHPSDGLCYNRYRAISFLISEKKNKYRQPDFISSQLAKIMKTLLVKRIDSSFFAFKQTLRRFKESTGVMVKMFEKGTIFIAPNFPVNEYIEEGREEELLDALLNLAPDDPTIEICAPSDFLPEFLEGLLHDYAILSELDADWAKMEDDPKLVTFVRYLDDILFNKKTNPEQKLVVFSESKETTEYLTDSLRDRIKHKILTVDSKNRKDKMPVVKANFDANISKLEQKNDFDMVISTEVLAEGVNLHRSNVIVNYDTPWNSTRLMQRIGRVNRIGSTAAAIHIYNFYPTAKVNSDIELEKKAIMKLQAFHEALGEDSQIYSPDEEFQTFGIFDHAVEEGRDERLGYLMAIRELKEQNPELFKRIKDMPLRARTGRVNAALSDGTVCFIRNNRRDAFLSLAPDNAIEELTFLETVKKFEAPVSEKSIPLHTFHHEQVKTGLAFFSAAGEREKARDKKIDVAQGPNEVRASNFLARLLNVPEINEEEREAVTLSLEAIRTGKFKNLQRDLNKLVKAVKKVPIRPVLLLAKVVAVIKSYPLENVSEPAEEISPYISNATFNPEIIISESFSAGSSPKGEAGKDEIS